MHQPFALTSLALASTLAFAGSAPAQVITQWIAPPGGPWEFGVSTNWTAGVPLFGDTALIDSASLALITAAGSVTTSVPTPGGPTHYSATQKTGYLLLRNGTVVLQGGALEIDGPGYWTVNIEGTNGTLIVKDFELLNEGVAVVGGGLGESGTAIITGPNAIWRSSINEVGGWFAVGALGSGDVTVSNGGLLSTGPVTFGDFFESPGGTALVTDPGSLWETSEFSIGQRGGNNLMVVENGGHAVATTWIQLGRYPKPVGFTYPSASGKAIVRDPGSQLSSPEGEILVGQTTTGELVIEKGGLAWAGGITDIGIQEGSNGDVQLRGIGSRLNTGTTFFSSEPGLTVGNAGTGTMLIEDGAVCDAGLSSVYVGRWAAGIGSLVLRDAGTLLTGFDLNIGTVEANPTGSGTMLIENGALAQFAWMSAIRPAGTLTIDNATLDCLSMTNEGALVGQGTVLGNVINRGTLSPGLGIGSLDLTDKLFLEAPGTLEIELGANALNGDHDLLTVADEATFGGTLRLIPTAGFVPACGDSFAFLTAVTATGSFDTVEIAGSPGLRASVSFDAGVATVTIGPDPNLTSNTTFALLATGGIQTLTLDGGSCTSGQLYLLLGSTATTPGFPIDGIEVPLDPSTPYFASTLANPNAPPLSGGFGSFGPTESATATVTIPPGLGAALSGTVLFHAFLVVDPFSATVTASSNAVPLLLL